MNTKTRSDILYLFFILLAFILVSVMLMALSGNISIDDSFIFFRYAKHLVTEHRFAYNPGGERVEGFTSFLWTVILAGIYKIGFDLDLAARVTGVIFGVLNLLLIRKICEKLKADYVIASLAIILNLGFMIWNSASGMDLALYSLLITLFYYSYIIKRDLLFLLSSLLLVLCRPEGIIIGFFGYAFLLMSRRRSPVPFKASAAMFSSFIVLSGVYVYLKYLYFGFIFPNTFYAKVGGISILSVINGSYYVMHYLTIYWPVVVLPAFFMFSALSKKEPSISDDDRRHSIFLASIIGLNFLIYIATGGDYFASYRHLQYVYPLLSILLSLGVSWLSASKTADDRSGDLLFVLFALFATVSAYGFIIVFFFARGTGQFQDSLMDNYGYRYLISNCLLAASSVLLFIRPNIGKYLMKTLIVIFIFTSIFKMPYLIWFEFQITAKYKQAGLWINRNLPKDVKVAVLLAGATPYYSDRFCIDTMGLNDVKIAHANKKPSFYSGIKNHASFNKDLFYRYDPDIFLVASDSFTRQVYDNIFSDYEFNKRYVPATLTLDNKESIGLYVRRK